MRNFVYQLYGLLLVWTSLPTGQNAGQAVTTSGGVSGTTGQAMETLSPFMSLNYIIYTGKV